MSKHLNADQMAEWMAGERRPELERHLRECAGCSLAMEELQTALGGWRNAVRGWSDRQYQVAQQRRAEGGAASMMSAVSRWAYLRFYWAAGATVMGAFAAVLLWYGAAAQRSVTPATDESAAYENAAVTNTAHGMNPDAVLMRQVDRDVSQTVPDALEPLMGLVSWDGAGAASEDAAGGKPKSKQIE